MSGSLTDGCLLKSVAGKTFHAFPAHAQPAVLRIWWEAQYHYTPAPPKVEWGYTGFTQMSVRPVDKVSGTFWKKLSAQFISYLEFNPYGVSHLIPIHFRVPSLIFDPLVVKYLAENGVSGTFWKKILAQLISYLAFILMGWVSWPLYIFLFLATFSPLWRPNIWPKMGFPELCFFSGTVSFCVFSIDFAVFWQIFYIFQTF